MSSAVKPVKSNVATPVRAGLSFDGDHVNSSTTVVGMVNVFSLAFSFSFALAPLFSLFSLMVLSPCLLSKQAHKQALNIYFFDCQRPSSTALLVWKRLAHYACLSRLPRVRLPALFVPFVLYIAAGVPS